MKNGAAVEEFEKRFAEYVGARFAVALCNGTATLHTALVALGVQPGDRVAVPPLTMSSTTIAVLHAGAVPVFHDVDPHTWLMLGWNYDCEAHLPVSLYGLSCPYDDGEMVIDDAAQTLRKHSGADFTSYSFQASKILALGEGGMLVTNNETLATRAREFSSLGYRMQATQPRIDKDSIKASDAVRHYSLGWNYRMNDLTAAKGVEHLERHSWTREVGEDFGDSNDVDLALANRRVAAFYYRIAIKGVPWLTPQYAPDGWTHDFWAYAVACDTPARAKLLQDMIVKHKGEKPFGCWRLTFDEPAFTHLDPGPEACPVARSLQPRLLQFATNNLASAEQNARALRMAIEEIGNG